MPYADRLDTPLEEAVDSKWAEAKTFVERLSPDEGDSLLFEAEMTGFVFCGHVMADLDSIAGAIGAAVSFSDETRDCIFVALSCFLHCISLMPFSTRFILLSDGHSSCMVAPRPVHPTSTPKLNLR